MKHTQTLPKIPKKPMDRLLEYLRFSKVKRYIPKRAYLLDVGTGDGSFLRFLDRHIRFGIGIDPVFTTSIELETYAFHPGAFPHDFETDRRFDVITLLAVVEHIPESDLQQAADTCWNILKPNGRVIITALHPFVDNILNVLKFLRILNGLSLEEHYGFTPECLPNIFTRWKLIKKARWQLGLNYLFIFEKPAPCQ